MWKLHAGKLPIILEEFLEYCEPNIVLTCVLALKMLLEFGL